MAVAIFAMGMAFSYSIQTPINQPQQTQPKESAKDSGAKSAVQESTDWNEKIAGYTWWLAWLTLAMAICTGGLWWIAASTARRQLRAYVTVEEGHILNFVAGETVRARVVLRNGGQTPAHDLTSIIGIRFVPVEQADAEGTPNIPETRGSRSPLGPGQRKYLASDFEVPLTTEMRNDVIRGTYTFQVVGRVDYVDAFRRPRHTVFNLFYGGRNSAHETGAMTNAPEGNSAT